MITDLKDVGEYITQKNLWEKPLCQFSRLEIEMFCQAILEYTETKDFKPPYINNRSELIIPFEAPVKYRWWQQGGQSLEATLNELGADDEIKKNISATGRDTFPGRYKLTRHAKNRMDERYILAPTVRAVLIHGKTRPAADMGIAITAFGYTVMIVGRKIVTVYEND